MITTRTDEKVAANGTNHRDANTVVTFEMKSLEFAIYSDAGRVRHNNEDRAAAAPEINLFVLCDGMGGLEAGERASQLGVETVLNPPTKRFSKSRRGWARSPRWAPRSSPFSFTTSAR
jgi:serine/threonine protein phosphatase PrpC